MQRFQADANGPLGASISPSPSALSTAALDIQSAIGDLFWRKGSVLNFQDFMTLMATSPSTSRSRQFEATHRQSCII